MVAQSVGNIGFENFILYALNYDEKDKDRLIYQASQHGISMSKKYICMMFAQTKDAAVNARDERKNFVRAFQDSSVSKFGRFAFLDENNGMILWDTQEKDMCSLKYLENVLKSSGLRSEKMQQYGAEFAICRDSVDSLSLKKSVQKCQKVMTMGRKLFAENRSGIMRCWGHMHGSILKKRNWRKC